MFYFSCKSHFMWAKRLKRNIVLIINYSSFLLILLLLWALHWGLVSLLLRHVHGSVFFYPNQPDLWVDPTCGYLYSCWSLLVFLSLPFLTICAVFGYYYCAFCSVLKIYFRGGLNFANSFYLRLTYRSHFSCHIISKCKRSLEPIQLPEYMFTCCSTEWSRFSSFWCHSRCLLTWTLRSCWKPWSLSRCTADCFIWRLSWRHVLYYRPLHGFSLVYFI